MKKNVVLFPLLIVSLSSCSFTPSLPDVEASSSTEASSVLSSSLSSEPIIIYHTVTFNPNNGEPNFTQKVEDGKKATKPSDPTKEGHTFVNWIDASSNKTWSFTDSSVTQDITLNAEYSANRYSISFNTNGGSAVETITQDYGTPITAPQNPTKEGYTFAGWDKDIPATMPSNNVTINATWNINQYTITFVDGSGNVVSTATQDYGASIVAPQNPTKEGYTFAGWDKNIPATMPSSDITITATWNVNQYTVTYVDGLGNTLSSSTEDYGTTITPPSDPTRVGYSFAGWDKDIPETTPSQDTTITANWSINQYTITYVDGFGNTISTVTQDYGTAISAPVDPTNEFYEFAGWDAETPLTMPANDLTIRATWTSSVFSFEDGMLIHCNSDSTALVIPSYTPTGQAVTSIGNSAFSSCYSLTSITLPSSLTSIGNYAFSSCSTLESVTIPEGITSIGNGAFSSCYSLTSITIPEGVVSIGDGAFSGCDSLTSVTLPSTLTSIGSSAFYNCRSLATIAIPSSVTSIGQVAFSDCTSIYIYCEADSKPDGWSGSWKGSASNIIWGVSESGKEGDYIYHIADGLAVLDKYTGSDRAVTIPETVNGYSVGSIGKKAFYGLNTLVSVVLPSNITSIGDDAFNCCSSLESIDIPSEVTSIGDNAFSYCTSLTSVTLPSSLISIGEGAFSGCTGLANIDIPSSVTTIGAWAFSTCSSFTSIALPSSVNSIGERAFYGCTSLISVTTTEDDASVSNSESSIDTSLGEYAFYECNSLKTVALPSGITSIGSYAFYYCSVLESATLPSTVTTIGDNAFSSSSKLKTVTLPEGLTAIGKRAFYCCSSLVNITIPSSLTSLGESAFYSCSALKTVAIPEGVTSISESTFSSCTSLISVTLPSTLISIGASAFFQCQSLTVINIPSSVTTIGNQAFDWCRKLRIYCESESKPDGWSETWNNYGCVTTWNVTNAGSIDGLVYYIKDGSAVIDCYKGDGGEVVIPETINGYPVTSIGTKAFSGCSKVTSITIPSSVTSIGDKAFYGCSNITSIAIPSSVTSIGNEAFYSCSSLTSIEIPSSVTSLGAFAFCNCSALETVSLPEGLTSIEEGTFYYCQSLSTINIPSTITSIGAGAFNCCFAINEIVIPEGLTTIGNSAFYCCTFLERVTLPSTLISIGDSAFYRCSSIGSITLPSTLISIGNSAFNNCSGLTSITIPSSVNSIGERAFYGCTSLSTVTIPSSVTTVGKGAFNISVSGFVINCEAESKPDGWEDGWYYIGATVNWGYTAE